MTRSAVSLLLGALFFACPVPVHADTAAPRIKLSSCVVTAGGVGGLDDIMADMKVRFVNESGETLKTIVWRGTTPVGTIDFTDNGTFSPGISIYRRPVYRGTSARVHHWTTNRAAFQVMGPGVCTPIETVSASGEDWKAPGVPPPAVDLRPLPLDSATPVPASLDNPLHDPVGIISCQFSLYWGHAYGTVRFRNLSSQPLTSITFRGLYGGPGIDFVKRGVFSPGAFVNSGNMTRRDLPPNAYQEYETLDAPSSCVAVSATFADGTVWRNAGVTETEPPFPVG